MLNLIGRRKTRTPLPVLPTDPDTVARTGAGPESGRRPMACALSACIAGSWATVLEVQCDDVDACRLRALGLCEGASVQVVRSRSRDCTLLEVRGARVALGPSIASGITVLPNDGNA